MNIFEFLSHHPWFSETGIKEKAGEIKWNYSDKAHPYGTKSPQKKEVLTKKDALKKFSKTAYSMSMNIKHHALIRDVAIILITSTQNKHSLAS